MTSVRGLQECYKKAQSLPCSSFPIPSPVTVPVGIFHVVKERWVISPCCLVDVVYLTAFVLSVKRLFQCFFQCFFLHLVLPVCVSDTRGAWSHHNQRLFKRCPLKPLGLSVRVALLMWSILQGSQRLSTPNRKESLKESERVLRP